MIPAQPVTIHAIQEAVSASYRIEPASMKAHDNRWRVSHPRQVAMYLARTMTAHSFTRIGYYFGYRDPSTILYGVREVERRIQADPAIRRRISRLKRRLAA